MTAHDTFSAAPAGLRELLALASDLALQAGRIHAEGRRQVLTIETKSSPTDVVSQVDKEAERLIVDRLRAERPDDALLAEEGSLLEGTSGVRWVVDPLDGTTNYVYGYPAYAASIAVEIDGHAAVGVVFDSSRRTTVPGGRRSRRGLRRPPHPRARAGRPLARARGHRVLVRRCAARAAGRGGRRGAEPHPRHPPRRHGRARPLPHRRRRGRRLLGARPLAVGLRRRHAHRPRGRRRRGARRGGARARARRAWPRTPRSCRRSSSC